MSCVPGVEGLRGRVGVGELIDWSKDTAGADVDASLKCAVEVDDPELATEAEWYTVEGVLGVSVGAAGLLCSVTGVGEFAGVAVVVVVVLGGSCASRGESVAVGDGKGLVAPGVSAIFVFFCGGRVDSDR